MMSDPPPFSGLLNFNKPTGITSAKALYRVRSLTGIRKSGHAGTLDPAADGVLLLCFGLSAPFYLGLLMLFLANIFASASQTFNHTAMQVLVDDAVRGRMSAFIVMSFGLTPLGVLPLAFAAERIGIAAAVVAASAALIAVVLLFYALSPTLRRMDQSVKAVLRDNDRSAATHPAPH